jgi:hypothetical protein
MKRHLHQTALSFAAAIALIGCGVAQQEQAPVNPVNDGVAGSELSPAELTQLESEYKELPASMMIRVAVDQDGKEIADSVEMARLSQEVDQENLQSSFESGELVQTTASDDSLDGDSSTQSWYGYNAYRGRGNNNGFDRNNYSNSALVNINGGINNSNVDIDIINSGNQRAFGNGNRGAYGNRGGQRWANSPYANWYRPQYRSRVYRGSWWRFRSPRCRTFGRFNYYSYPRPRCGYSFCGGFNR